MQACVGQKALSDVKISVRVKYLSAVRDRTNRKEDILMLPVGATLRDVVAWLAAERDLLWPDPQVMATLNGRGWGQLEHGLDTRLTDDDVICFFPLISGG